MTASTSSCFQKFGGRTCPKWSAVNFLFNDHRINGLAMSGVAATFQHHFRASSKRSSENPYSRHEPVKGNGASKTIFIHGILRLGIEPKSHARRRRSKHGACVLTFILTKIIIHYSHNHYFWAIGASWICSRTYGAMPRSEWVWPVFRGRYQIRRHGHFWRWADEILTRWRNLASRTAPPRYALWWKWGIISYIIHRL